MKVVIKTIFAGIVLLGSSIASANLIISGPNSGTCQTVDSNGVTAGSCTLQAITEHPAWQDNNPLGNGAVWVSSSNSGLNGISVPNSSVTPYMRIIEEFVGNAFTLKIWADDTAAVFVNGVEIIGENLTQGTCAAGIIGCEPNEFGLVTMSWSNVALRTIQIDVYQTGGSVSGTLYSGSFSVPAPAPLALLGLGLVGIAFFRRKITM